MAGRCGSGKTCRLMSMLCLTLSFFFVELVFGILSNSMALVADSFHMLSDVLALLIAFACMKISRRKSSANTFGWVRAEVLGALVNAVFLLALCFSIFVEAIKRLFEPHQIEEPLNVLIVGIVGLVVNIIGIFMFHGHASVEGHSHARPVPLDLDEEEAEFQHLAAEAHSISVLQANETSPNSAAQASKMPLVQSPNSKPSAKKKSGGAAHGHGHSHDAGQLNMHGVFLHILGDAFGSIIVIINALINWRVENEAVQKYLDPSLSLVMVLIISSTTIPLIRESANILLQSIPPHINVAAIRADLLRLDGLLALHDLHVWRLAGNKIIATAHIQVRSLDDYARLAPVVKTLFHDWGIHSTTIQPEFAPQDGGTNCAQACPSPCNVDLLCCDGSPPKEKGGKKGSQAGATPTPAPVPLPTLHLNHSDASLPLDPQSSQPDSSNDSRTSDPASSSRQDSETPSA